MSIHRGIFSFFLVFFCAITITACYAPSSAGNIGIQLASNGAFSFPEDLNLSGSPWTVQNVFTNLGFLLPTSFIADPRSNRIYVTQNSGEIYSFENDPDTTEFNLVLDLSSQTYAESESGLYSIVLHPDFGLEGPDNSHYFYVVYSFLEDPSETNGAKTITYSRLSRFTLNDDGLTADPDSELVLIDQQDEYASHLGGATFFNPNDGFLYVSFGDEGGGRCRYGNCQIIDTDLFSGILRIDVDEQGGDISHAIVNQPATGTTAHYYIPNDNPFVGVDGALEEFYALGLRHPYKMTYDAHNDLIWIGDVGDSSQEEIDLLYSGANFQWEYLEGTFLNEFGVTYPSPILGTWQDPFYTYDHDIGSAIIGGYVSLDEDENMADLYGKYIFGDYITDKVFALEFQNNGNGDVDFVSSETLIDGTGESVIGFGTDNDNHIYALGYGSISRLVRNDSTDESLVSSPPETLSETGLFQDLSTLTPSPALVSYEVNTSLWSDGAEKYRWFTIPEGTHITYSENGNWQFPPGSIFVKHFEINTDENDPSTMKRLETRVLFVKTDSSVYGVTYKWNNEGTEANLLSEQESEVVSIRQTDGSALAQTWTYPNSSNCLRCHTEGAGYILGVKSRQLNKGHTYDNGATGNQLTTLNENGFFDQLYGENDLLGAEKLVSLDDRRASSENKIKSYLDANCSHCHGSTEMSVIWDARYSTPLHEMGIIDVESATGGKIIDTSSLDPEDSLLYQRVNTNDLTTKMPPLGRSVIDEDFVEALREWLDELSAD